MLNSTSRNIAQKAIALTLLGLPFLVLTPIVAIANSLNGITPFYTARRFGLNGEPFRVIKFKSMRDGNEPDAERVTTIGKLLRKTSLDEIPQLINVLKGEMDMIGWRPLDVRHSDVLAYHRKKSSGLPEPSIVNTQGVTLDNARLQSVEFFLEEMKQVKPGISGSAQISSLRGLDIRDSADVLIEAVQKDYNYVQTRKKGTLASIWQDAVIIVKTPLSLIFHPGHVARKPLPPILDSKPDIV